MKLLIALLLVSASLSLPCHADLAAEISKQAQAARAILDAWHAHNPRPATRKLHLVYWTPSDRAPAPHYRERLTRILSNIQEFYATEMERIGFGPRTIQLDRADDDLLRIHLVKGAGPYADYEVQSGAKIRTECLPTLREAGIDPDRETIVIFCNLGEWDAEKKTIRHKSPYYAGGSAKQGTAWQLDSPILDTENLKLKQPIIRDGQYGRISLGKHNSIFIGGVAHELGHALGLPHNKERPDEKDAFGTALMGSGNQTYADELRNEGRGSFLTLAHAMRLASHPQFSGSIKGLFTPTRAKIDQLEVTPAAKSFRLSGKITSATPAYAVVAYMDPAGGGDYNSTTTSAVPDADGNFTLDCTALRKDKTAQLRVVACLANGTTRQQSFEYRVGADGKPDLSTLQLKLSLAKVVAAINARDGDAKKAAAGLEDPRARAIAKRLLSPVEHLPPPAEIDVQATPLADTAPKVEKVGWMRPSYNRLPNKEILLESGGEIFATGIYAHAPAEHRYQLGGKWSKLTGKCGIAASARGSVVFTIECDGEERWRSPVTKPGNLQMYQIDLAGVKELQLKVSDAGDGTASDWGLWLEPVIE